LSGTETSFAVANNGDWIDGMFFGAPGTSGAPFQVTGHIVAGTNVVESVASVGEVLPGMGIGQVPGIPAGAFVGDIATSSFTMVDIDGNPLNATATAPVTLNLEPLPLDLTGIRFKAELRATPGGNEVFLAADTEDGTLVNGGRTGVLAFSVPEAAMGRLNPGDYVMDIVAEADGQIISLFPEGPCAVVVAEGVTTP